MKLYGQKACIDNNSLQVKSLTLLSDIKVCGKLAQQDQINFIYGDLDIINILKLVNNGTIDCIFTMSDNTEVDVIFYWWLVNSEFKGLICAKDDSQMNAYAKGKFKEKAQYI